MNLYLEQISVGATLPSRGTTDAACFDVHADLSRCEGMFVWNDNTAAPISHHINWEGDGSLYLPSRCRALIPTGFKMCCDPGYCIEVYPRSGKSFKQGLSLNNCVGVIDADYRDEVFVSVINHSDVTIVIKHGEAIAQLRLAELLPTTIKLGKLPPTGSDRNGGFGSTDK